MKLKLVIAGCVILSLGTVIGWLIGKTNNGNQVLQNTVQTSDSAQSTETDEDQIVLKNTAVQHSISCVGPVLLDNDVALQIKEATFQFLNFAFNQPSDYRIQHIALNRMGLDASTILKPILNKYRNRLQNSSTQAFWANLDNNDTKWVIHSFEKFYELDEISFQHQLNETINDADIVSIFINGKQVFVTKFGAYFLYYMNSGLALDETESILKSRASGFIPSIVDFVTLADLNFDKRALRNLIPEMESNPSYDINTFVSVPGIGTRNILTLALEANDPDFVGLALDSGANYIDSWHLVHSLDDSVKFELITRVLEYQVGPIKKSDSNKLIRYLQNSTLSRQITPGLFNKLTYDFEKLDKRTREEVIAFIKELSTKIFVVINSKHEGLGKACFSEYYNSYVANIDWRTKEQIQFLKSLQTKAPSLEAQILKPQLPTITFKQKDESDVVVNEAQRIELDLNEEQLGRLFKLASEGDSKSIDELFDSEFEELVDQEAEYLLKLSMAVIAKDEKRFAELVPYVNEIPSQIFSSIVNFDSGILAARSLRSNGHNLDRKFTKLETNLLVHSMKSRNFELFSFLQDEGISTRPSPYTHDAVDQGLMILVQSGDWRYIDKVMTLSPSLRETNEEVLSQIENEYPKIAEELKLKHPSLF